MLHLSLPSMLAADLSPEDIRDKKAVTPTFLPHLHMESAGRGVKYSVPQEG